MDLELPPDVRDDWRAVDGRTDEGRLAGAAVRAETTVYERVPAVGALEILRNGNAVPVRSLFTVGTTISPPPSALGIDPADALETATEAATGRLVDVLADDGIAVGDRRYDQRVRRADGTVGRLTVSGADYPVPASAADLAGADEAAGSAAGDAPADGPGDPSPADGPGGRSTIDAEVHVAVLPTAEAYAVVGGIVPLSDPFAGDGGKTDGLDVAPDRDRRTILEVVRSVDLPGGRDRGEDEPADGDGSDRGE